VAVKRDLLGGHWKWPAYKENLAALRIVYN